jgi:hypothetical protein
MQAPLQAVWAPAQESAQALLEQTCVPEQEIPQPPQAVGTLAVFVSQPSVALPLQSARVAVHAPTAHAPSRQLAAPWAIEHGLQPSVAHP